MVKFETVFITMGRIELRYKLGLWTMSVVRWAEEAGLSRDGDVPATPSDTYMDRPRAGDGFVKSIHVAQYV